MTITVGTKLRKRDGRDIVIALEVLTQSALLSTNENKDGILGWVLLTEIVRDYEIVE